MKPIRVANTLFFSGIASTSNDIILGMRTRHENELFVPMLKLNRHINLLTDFYAVFIVMVSKLSL